METENKAVRRPGKAPSSSKDRESEHKKESLKDAKKLRVGDDTQQTERAPEL